MAKQRLKFGQIESKEIENLMEVDQEDEESQRDKILLKLSKKKSNPDQNLKNLELDPNLYTEMSKS